MNYKVYSNGKEISDMQTIALLRDESIGVFESMRAYNGKIFLLEEHLVRLFDSARTVRYKPLPDLKKIRQELKTALDLSGEKNTSVRLTLLNNRIFVIVGARRIAKEFYEKGIVLKTASFPRGSGNAFPYQTKVSAYQQAVLASTEPNSGGAFDWSFLDQGNYLTETRTGNFFLVKYPITLKQCDKSHCFSVKEVRAELLTPPERLILNGVTRCFVIKCAHEIGLKVRETPLTRHEFFNADEAFLTNTSWEILPVRELDGRAIGMKIPGPVTAKLHRFFQRRVQELCPSK